MLKTLFKNSVKFSTSLLAFGTAMFLSITFFNPADNKIEWAIALGTVFLPIWAAGEVTFGLIYLFRSKMITGEGKLRWQALSVIPVAFIVWYIVFALIYKYVVYNVFHSL